MNIMLKSSHLQKKQVGIDVPSTLRRIAATISVCGFLYCVSSFGDSLVGAQAPLVSAPQGAQYVNAIESPPVIDVVGGGFYNRTLWSPIMESPSALAQTISTFSTETTYQLFSCSAIADAAKAQLDALSLDTGIEKEATKIQFVLQALIEKLDSLANVVDATFFKIERSLA
jgi:hypothetical protein